MPGTVVCCIVVLSLTNFTSIKCFLFNFKHKNILLFFLFTHFTKSTNNYGADLKNIKKYPTDAHRDRCLVFTFRWDWRGAVGWETSVCWPVLASDLWRPLLQWEPFRPSPMPSRPTRQLKNQQTHPDRAERRHPVSNDLKRDYDTLHKAFSPAPGSCLGGGKNISFNVCVIIGSSCHGKLDLAGRAI